MLVPPAETVVVWMRLLPFCVFPTPTSVKPISQDSKFLAIEFLDIPFTCPKTKGLMWVPSFSHFKVISMP